MQIMTTGGTRVGKISKQWSGMAREFFTDVDYFGVSFPMHLDVYTKATLLAACMLIVNIHIAISINCVCRSEWHRLELNEHFTPQDGIFYSKG